MNNIQIIFDTMNDVASGIIEKYDNIEMLPVSIVLDGKEYKAGVDITGDEFYTLLRNSNEIPKTSQITYTTFKETFEKYLSQGKKVLYMAGSSNASGTYQSSMLAKNDIENNEDIYIFDTYNLSIGGGMLIAEAAEMIEQGLDIKEILNKLEEYKDKVEVYFSVDTLDYLHKGGRISSTTATVGSLLSIKPILKLDDGMVKSKDKVRGTKKIVPALIKHLREECGDLSDKCVYVGYGDDVDGLNKFIEIVKNELNPKEIKVFQIGPCVACHSGPDVVGIGALNK